MGRLASHPGALWAAKGGAAFLSIYTAERLWRQHHRGEAIPSWSCRTASWPSSQRVTPPSFAIRSNIFEKMCNPRSRVEQRRRRRYGLTASLDEGSPPRQVHENVRRGQVGQGPLAGRWLIV